MRPSALCVCIALILAFGSQAADQKPSASDYRSMFQDEMALLRTDMRSEKRNLVTSNMQLTPTDAAKFWPIYEDYEAEIHQIWNDRIALIEQYASVHESITDTQADDIMTKALDLDQKLVKLRKTYYQKFKEALSAKTAARFVQVDRRLSNLTDLQVAGSIPLVQ